MINRLLARLRALCPPPSSRSAGTMNYNKQEHQRNIAARARARDDDDDDAAARPPARSLAALRFDRPTHPQRSPSPRSLGMGGLTERTLRARFVSTVPGARLERFLFDLL